MSPSKFSYSSYGLLGSYPGAFAIANISPLLGFIIVMDTRFALCVSRPSLATSSA